MVYSLTVFEARFSPQEPLKVKLSTKFQGVDFSISENSSAANVLNTRFSYYQIHVKKSRKNFE